ncbi:MAG: DUF1330 domain-containing protein [Nannocystaceae bacterium]|nr:DUF1330 domain-containing protein [Nannocystaceae bacterium]
MSAFVIVHGVPKDNDKLKAYSQAAAPTFAAFGGEIVGKGKPEILTGTHSDTLVAVIAFPDANSARGWYASPDYQALIAKRDDAMACTFILCG